MSEAYEGIRRGLLDAIAYAKGDTSRGRIIAGPTCPCEGGEQGHPSQDQTQPVQVRRQTARAGRHRARMRAAPPLARCSGADAAGDGAYGPEGSVGVD